MNEDAVVALPRSGSSLADDPLLVVLREGAGRMLMQAVEAEVEAFLVKHGGLVDGRGRQRLVRTGHAPEQQIQTGIGPLEVRRPRLRDRAAGDEAPMRFTAEILPAYLRRTRNVEELLPSGLWPDPKGGMSAKLTGLYLKGVSTGQFEEALAALLGPDAPGLSAATVRRLTEAWQEEHARWQGRDLSSRRYVHLWADGVYFTPSSARRRRVRSLQGARQEAAKGLEHERPCMLVLIGADASGGKELLAIEDGFRESGQSWKELLLRLCQENGLVFGPELATGDGALGFWQALHQVWPSTRQQRCWVYKTATSRPPCPSRCTAQAAALPFSPGDRASAMAKQDLHAIDEALSREEAELAFDRFKGKYGPKYDKAAACLAKDRAALLAFYTAPAEHWKHVRTTNPIESTFATVRLRTAKTKGRPARQTALAMVFKLAKSAERHWRRLDGTERLAQVIAGVRFRDGEPVRDTEEQAAA